ncbi:MAG: carbamoyl phosphate synthase small subunit, partial [Pseudomonadota bacterium]
MANTADTSSNKATGAIVLADGTAWLGQGCGAPGVAIGELCFNTAVTGYQEILTDPSYAEQIILFTFPHIGNVGANDQDLEFSTASAARAAKGTVFRAPITPPSNWRAVDHFGAWLRKSGIVGLSGVDTRALTRRIRERGMAKAAIVHAPDGNIDVAALAEAAFAWKGLEQADLAVDVTQPDSYDHAEKLWQPDATFPALGDAKHHVVVVDFGVKKNILRNLSQVGARATIVSGDTSAAEILDMKPDGVVFSNGPGDPAATFQRSGEMIKGLVASGVPILGICLGHQLLALALGA